MLDASLADVLLGSALRGLADRAALGMARERRELPS